MNRTVRMVGAVCGCALALGIANVVAQDWPQWRGPNRDNKVEGFIAPKSWPKELVKKWTEKVGAGVSSPVLVGDKVYAFGRIGGDEALTCLDAASGKQLWQEKYATAAVGGAPSGYGGPRSTPAVADGKVFTLGVNGTVSCVDATSGKMIWRKDTGEKPQFNTATSPLVADGKCVVFLSTLLAYDVTNGDVKWKGPSGTPYGSPVLMTVDNTKMIVTPTANALVGVNLADGKVLWQAKLPPGNYSANYPTPIIDGQTVIYGSPGKGTSNAMALKIEKKGDSFTTSEVWKGSSAYQYSTPVLKDNLLFGLSAGKSFYCMDARTGKVLWTDSTARGEAGGVLNAGSVILALTGPAPGPKGKGTETTTGDAELVAFAPDAAGYKEIAKYKLAPATGLAYPIVAGKRVYVRGNNDVTLWTIE
jgi:outer membrane protein assembly factor BamB